MVNVMNFAVLGVPLRMGAIFRPCCHDSAIHHSIRHQRHSIFPDCLKRLLVDVHAGAMRIDLRPEEQLCPIDISDARKDGLIHEQCPDGRFALADDLKSRSRIGIFAQRVGTETLE